MGALRAIAPMDDEAGFAPVLDAMRPRQLAPGEALLQVGQQADDECVLLEEIGRASCRERV